MSYHLDGDEDNYRPWHSVGGEGETPRVGEMLHVVCPNETDPNSRDYFKLKVVSVRRDIQCAALGFPYRQTAFVFCEELP